MSILSRRSLITAFALALSIAASAPALAASKSDLEAASKQALDKLVTAEGLSLPGETALA